MRVFRGHLALWTVEPLLVLAGVVGGQTETSESAVDVKVTTYKELGEAVKGLKGKVVIVDFWGLT